MFMFQSFFVYTAESEFLDDFFAKRSCNSDFYVVSYAQKIKAGEFSPFLVKIKNLCKGEHYHGTFYEETQRGERSSGSG